MFQSGDQEITNTVQLDVDDLYPGMEDYLYQISAYNRYDNKNIDNYDFKEKNVINMNKNISNNYYYNLNSSNDKFKIINDKSQKNMDNNDYNLRRNFSQGDIYV